MSDSPLNESFVSISSPKHAFQRVARRSVYVSSSSRPRGINSDEMAGVDWSSHSAPSDETNSEDSSMPSLQLRKPSHEEASQEILSSPEALLSSQESSSCSSHSFTSSSPPPTETTPPTVSPRMPPSPKEDFDDENFLGEDEKPTILQKTAKFTS